MKTIVVFVSVALIPVGCSVEQGRQRPITTLSKSHSFATKDRDADLSQRERIISESLREKYRHLSSCFDEGEWQEALVTLDQIEDRWKREKVFMLPDVDRRAEALIGLGRVQEAVTVLTRDPKRQIDPSQDLTLALALALNGEVDPQRAAEFRRQTADPFFDLPTEAVAVPQTLDQNIAVIRLARAVKALFQGQDQTAQREAEEALRLDPRQRLAAYMLGEVYGRADRLEDAIRMYQVASTLPGKVGALSRSYKETGEAILRDQGQQ